MKLEIRERDRRALLLLAVAAIVGSLLYFGLLPAFDALKAGSFGVAGQEQELSKYRRAVIRKGHYTQLLEQTRKNVAADEVRFIRGDNPTLAAVELQTIVEGAAQKMGFELEQRNISTARKKDEFFNEITMTIAFQASPAQMSGFLAEIRNAPKFVIVRNAQIAPTEILQEAPQKGAFKKMLRANLTITAALPIPERKNVP
jgi:hypothetical protein